MKRSLFSLIFIFSQSSTYYILKNYFHIHGTLEFNGMRCLSFAENIGHFDECRIKAIDRSHNSITVRPNIKKYKANIKKI